MTGGELRLKRVAAGISGNLICQKIGLRRNKLSDIERGFVIPTHDEVERVVSAIDDLAAVRKKIAAVAAEAGWPLAAAL